MRFRRWVRRRRKPVVPFPVLMIHALRGEIPEALR